MWGNKAIVLHTLGVLVHTMSRDKQNIKLEKRATRGRVRSSMVTRNNNDSGALLKKP